MSQIQETIFTIMSRLANEYQAINLGQGFPDYACDRDLLNLIKKYVDKDYHQYAPMSGSVNLRRALAQKIKHFQNRSLNPDKEICITSGATQALFTAILALIEKGDEVIIIEPAYDSYLPSIQKAGAIPVVYSLRYPDYKINWEEFGQLISPKTKMIIINTPHNPTGSILDENDFKALEKLSAEHDFYILSDEVYEHLIYEDQQHQSVLRYESLYPRSLAVYSFGKTLHATGWKLGYCVGPENLIEKFKSVHQWNVFSSNSFIQEALAEYLEEPQKFERLGSFFQAKRDYLKKGLENSPLKALECKGTYFQLYDYSDYSDQDDRAFAIHLTKKHGLASIPLSPFRSQKVDEKVIRLCFAKTEKTLDKAINKLKAL